MSFKELSLNYQQKLDCLIGQYQKRLDIQNSLYMLRDYTGDVHMMKLLDNSHCVASLEAANAIVAQTNPSFNDKCTSITEFENNFVVYKGILLEKNDIKVAVPKGYTMAESPQECGETKTTMKIEFQSLSNIKVMYMDQIINNLEDYIPIQQLEFYELLNQKTWVRGAPILTQQPKTEKYLQELCKFYNIQYTNVILQSWLDLVKSIFNSKFPWCLIEKDKPSIFWMRILKDDYPMDSNLKWIIKSAITTPLGNNLNLIK